MAIGEHRLKTETGIGSGTRAASYALKIEAQTQGFIKGDIPKTWKDAADQIEIMSWSHSVKSPRDVHTGTPTGKRIHQALECVGKISKAAPLLFTAITKNENLKKVVLTCWSQAKGGQGATIAIYYTIELKNASIAELEQITEDTDGTLFYRMQFTYEQIDFIWKDGGFTGSDTWEVTA